ncbi:MAG: hypothetical protein V1846_02660 [Candidatus Komeilibacteria bacterium]
MYSFRIVRDIYRDAWNWWDACNKASFGVDWKSSVSDPIVAQIIGKTQEEADQLLLPFLDNKYKQEEAKIQKFIADTTEYFNDNFQIACTKMVKVMGHPLYRTDFTFIITTFPRSPYNKNKGYIWICPDRPDPLHVFLHELCHFQFIHYWREDPKSPVAKLSNDAFEYLKESLTIILDQNFVPPMQRPDRGYIVHQEFRKELTAQWTKNHDFDQLVKFGTERVVSYCPKD